MDNSDMEILRQKQQQEETETENDFVTKLDRFRQVRRNGLEVEVSILQTEMLIKYGTWID